jgi:hypothetical protein
MNRMRLKCALVLGSFILLHASAGTAQLGDLVKRAEQQLGNQSGSNLSDDKVVSGLKEALRVSTGNAVAKTGRVDGYLKNEAIKILLPPKLKTVGSGMRLVGMGSQVDELEIGMNRAAEKAAPQAKAIFLASLKKMTFTDARQILSGGDTAATDYFKRTSTPDLTKAFKPIVHQSMLNVGVVQQYNKVLATAPGGTALAGQFDLTDYVVQKSLDGLFYELGQEETNIRRNPAAQTTSLLKEVFGKK